MRFLVRCIQPLGRSAETCAEFMVAPLLDPANKGGFHLFGSNAQIAQPTTLHSKEAREFILDWTFGRLDEALKSEKPSASR